MPTKWLLTHNITSPKPTERTLWSAELSEVSSRVSAANTFIEQWSIPNQFQAALFPRRRMAWQFLSREQKAARGSFERYKMNFDNLVERAAVAHDKPFLWLKAFVSDPERLRREFSFEFRFWKVSLNNSEIDEIIDAQSIFLSEKLREWSKRIVDGQARKKVMVTFLNHLKMLAGYDVFSPPAINDIWEAIIMEKPSLANARIQDIADWLVSNDSFRMELSMMLQKISGD